jgi:hypothetical protein
MEENIKQVELPCGCLVFVPSNLNDGEYIESWLYDNGHTQFKRVGNSSYDMVCSHCHKTLLKDI